MPYFEWSQDLSVNGKEIDDEHRMLIGMINTLNDAMLAHKGREAQKATIESMVDYAATHFATEERYMQAFRYQGYPAHRVEHQKFTAKALELKTRADNSGFILTLEIVTFLKSWLQNHIMGTDKRYQACFNEHGLR
ncbi:MAG TPA: bacteriohemerythrin [Spirochaetia bacterium]|nr:bacteriohemerythrin [Spirochaetia bacterium]